MTKYFVSLRIHSKCGEMRTRITPNTDSFYAVDGVSKNTISAMSNDSVKSLFLPLIQINTWPNGKSGQGRFYKIGYRRENFGFIHCMTI